MTYYLSISLLNFGSKNLVKFTYDIEASHSLHTFESIIKLSQDHIRYKSG